MNAGGVMQLFLSRSGLKACGAVFIHRMSVRDRSYSVDVCSDSVGSIDRVATYPSAG